MIILLQDDKNRHFFFLPERKIEMLNLCSMEIIIIYVIYVVIIRIMDEVFTLLVSGYNKDNSYTVRNVAVHFIAVKTYTEE